MTQLVSFNPHNRIDPFTRENSRYASSRLNTTYQEIFEAALPILSLHRKSLTTLTALSGGFMVWEHGKECLAPYRSKNWGELAQKILTVAFVSLATICTLFYTRASFALSFGYQTASDIPSMMKNLYRLEVDAFFTKTLRILSGSAYLASMVWIEPELLVLSLFLQALVELKASYKNYHRGKYFLSASQILVALFRLGNIKPHLKPLSKYYLRPKITQETLDAIRLKTPEFLIFYKNDEIYIRKRSIFIDLVQNGYSPQLNNLDLSHWDFSAIEIKNIRFFNCNFNHSNFDASALSSCHFFSCSMEQSSFMRSAISNSLFVKNNMQGSSFFQASLENVFFQSCDLSQISFNQSILRNVVFTKCRLSEANFFLTKIQNVWLGFCDLSNALLCRAKNKVWRLFGRANHFTKPVVALSWDHLDNGAYAEKIDEALREKGAIPFLFDYRVSYPVQKKVQCEVETLLYTIENEKNWKLSRLDEVLQRAPQGGGIDTIKAFAEEIHENIHACILPGGEDVEPEFYGEMNISSSTEDDDYVRSVYEAALIKKVYNSGKPLMGICRGAQLGNVYLGGSLYQDIPWELGGGLQRLQVHKEFLQKTSDPFFQHFSKGFTGCSMHHQANKELGKGMSTLLSYRGIPKLMVDKEGRVILSQFHPEAYLFLAEELEKLPKKMHPKIEQIFSMTADTIIERNSQVFDLFLDKIKTIE
jgi:gamma-glutamyl-gamma-aminobutyrate hydrolase PuuD